MRASLAEDDMFLALAVATRSEGGAVLTGEDCRKGVELTPPGMVIGGAAARLSIGAVRGAALAVDGRAATAATRGGMTVGRATADADTERWC
jgi:hypothetical protein